MTVYQLAQRAPALKRIYRDKVRADRARRREEQQAANEEGLEGRGLDMGEVQMDADAEVEEMEEAEAPND